MTYIDPKSIRRVTVVRRSQSQDSSGDYGAATDTTLYSGVVADIQPASRLGAAMGAAFGSC